MSLSQRFGVYSMIEKWSLTEGKKKRLGGTARQHFSSKTVFSLTKEAKQKIQKIFLPHQKEFLLNKIVQKLVTF